MREDPLIHGQKTFNAKTEQQPQILVSSKPPLQYHEDIMAINFHQH